MPALLHNLPLLHHCNAVGVDDGGEAVGHHHGGAPHHQLVQSILHHTLALSIQSRGGFVQQQDLWVFQNGAGDGDALLLSS